MVRDEASREGEAMCRKVMLYFWLACIMRHACSVPRFAHIATIAEAERIMELVPADMECRLYDEDAKDIALAGWEVSQ